MNTMQNTTMMNITENLTSTLPTVSSTVLHDKSSGHFDKALMFGSTIAIAGNLLISFGLNLQKFAHMKLKELCDVEKKPLKHYTRSPFWWCGISLVILGEIGNFTAFGFAPVTAVAPLGAIVVMANSVLAVCWLKEKFNPVVVIGCAVAVIGAIFVVIFSHRDNNEKLDGEHLIWLLTRVSFMVYSGILIVAMITLLLVIHVFKKLKLHVLLLTASVFASFTVISAKAVSSMLQLTFAGDMQLNQYIFYIMLIILAITAVLQVMYINMAMRLYEANVLIPINYVMFTVSAIVAGIILFQELWNFTVQEVLLFTAGFILCCLGVTIITIGSRKDANGDPKACIMFTSILPAWMLGGAVITTIQGTVTVAASKETPPQSISSNDLMATEESKLIPKEEQTSGY